MKVRLKLKPGQKGAKKLTALYGDKLVCVRYRYDELQKKRFTTVELIVEEIPWKQSPADNKTAFLDIKFEEELLRNKVKQAGGLWHPSKKLWSLQGKKVKALGLEKRVKYEE